MFLYTLESPYVHLYLSFKILNTSFKYTHLKEYLSLTYIIYANASNNTPSYTHISSYVA